MPDSWLYDQDGNAILYQEGEFLHDAETGQRLYRRDDDKVWDLKSGQLAFTVSGQGLHRAGGSQLTLLYGLLPRGKGG